MNTLLYLGTNVICGFKDWGKFVFKVSFLAVLCMQAGHSLVVIKLMMDMHAEEQCLHDMDY